MSTIKFAEIYNLVVFLEKLVESEGFEQIVDFLNANPIKYALTVNPTIYTSCIQQFWDYAKVKIINEDVQIRSLVDEKKLIVNEASIRRDLKLEDAEGTACLPNDTIFEELARMGTMAFAINCLANNLKFNFSKYIFDNMVKNLEARVKFFMFLRFVQVFVNHQLGDMSHHKKIFVTPSLTKKKKQKSKRKLRKEIEVPSPSNEIPNKEGVSTTSNDPLHSGEDGMKLYELMNLCTNLHKQVLDLEKAKTAHAKEIVALKKESSKDKKSLGDQKVASKQGRMIDNIDQDVEITLVDETHVRMNEEEMLGVYDLDGDEVVVDATAGEEVEQSTKVSKKEVSTANPVTTVGEVVTTAKDVEVTTVATTLHISKDELTLAQTLIEIKAAKPKAKGVIVQEPTMKRVNTFMDMNTKIMEERSKKTHAEVIEGSSKRVGDELEQENAKRQRLEEENESAELKRCLEIVSEDDNDVTIEATPLSSKSATIVDYKIYKEERKATSKSSEQMSIVKERFKKTKPVDDIDNLLSQTLKTIYEHQVEDNIWKISTRESQSFKLETFLLLWNLLCYNTEYGVLSSG
uniref:Xylulose kinase-1 n=1 Tax=Tanacetum cinerariifolium TaxID=118510 RepID=A0A6L2J7L7_TANCI|nr:hypothetical protein [Tanacetum cinerariifolium]